MVQMYPAYRAFVKVKVITEVTREIHFRAPTSEEAEQIAQGWTPDYVTQVGQYMLIEETPTEILDVQVIPEEEWMKR